MITVFFITNRNLIVTPTTSDFGPTFNPDGSASLRFGFAEVPEASFTDDKKLADIRITVEPENLTAGITDPTKLGSWAAFERIRLKMEKHSRDTVVFIHGFANTFRNALRHAAMLKAWYDVVPFNMVLVSWPSDGEMVPFMSYYSDRNDARASGPSMARAFIKLADYLERLRKANIAWCEQRLHLMAHSMGNYALRNAVQGIRGELGDEPPRLFDHVFMFAADEDDDAFEHDHKLRLLPRLARAVHVYFNPRDLALVISDTTKRNPDRLGSDGPRLTDDLPRKINLINCRDVAKIDKRDTRGHDYHRFVRPVINDINQVLKGVLPENVKGRKYFPETRSYQIVPPR